MGVAVASITSTPEATKGRGKGGVFSTVSSSESQNPVLTAPDSSETVLMKDSEKELNRSVLSNQYTRKVCDVCKCCVKMIF